MAKDKLEEYRTKATIIMALASIVTAIVAVASARTYLFPLIVYGSFVFLFVALVVIVWPFSVRPVFIFSKNKIDLLRYKII